MITVTNPMEFTGFAEYQRAQEQLRHLASMLEAANDRYQRLLEEHVKQGVQVQDVVKAHAVLADLLKKAHADAVITAEEKRKIEEALANQDRELADLNEAVEGHKMTVALAQDEIKRVSNTRWARVGKFMRITK